MNVIILDIRQRATHTHMGFELTLTLIILKTINTIAYKSHSTLFHYSSYHRIYYYHSVYRMRPLGVHLSLKSWTLWSTREGGERTGVPDETTRCPLES